MVLWTTLCVVVSVRLLRTVVAGLVDVGVLRPGQRVGDVVRYVAVDVGPSVSGLVGAVQSRLPTRLSDDRRSGCRGTGGQTYGAGATVGCPLTFTSGESFRYDGAVTVANPDGELVTRSASPSALTVS